MHSIHEGVLSSINKFITIYHQKKKKKKVDNYIYIYIYIKSLEMLMEIRVIVNIMEEITDKNSWTWKIFC